MHSYVFCNILQKTAASELVLMYAHVCSDGAISVHHMALHKIVHAYMSVLGVRGVL